LPNGIYVTLPTKKRIKEIAMLHREGEAATRKMVRELLEQLLYEQSWRASERFEDQRTIASMKRALADAEQRRKQMDEYVRSLEQEQQSRELVGER
jgi:hypothetical protein